MFFILKIDFNICLNIDLGNSNLNKMKEKRHKKRVLPGKTLIFFT